MKLPFFNGAANRVKNYFREKLDDSTEEQVPPPLTNPTKIGISGEANSCPSPERLNILSQPPSISHPNTVETISELPSSSNGNIIDQLQFIANSNEGLTLEFASPNSPDKRLTLGLDLANLNILLVSLNDDQPRGACRRIEYLANKANNF